MTTERRELLENIRVERAILKDEIDEIDADLPGWKYTLEDLQEQLADTLREIKETKEGIVKMKAKRVELIEQRKALKTGVIK